jgi:hypothetical protein
VRQPEPEKDEAECLSARLIGAIPGHQIDDSVFPLEKNRQDA